MVCGLWVSTVFTFRGVRSVFSWRVDVRVREGEVTRSRDVLGESLRTEVRVRDGDPIDSRVVVFGPSLQTLRVRPRGVAVVPLLRDSRVDRMERFITVGFDGPEPRLKRLAALSGLLVLARVYEGATWLIRTWRTDVLRRLSLTVVRTFVGDFSVRTAGRKLVRPTRCSKPRTRSWARTMPSFSMVVPRTVRSGR